MGYGLPDGVWLAAFAAWLTALPPLASAGTQQLGACEPYLTEVEPVRVLLADQATRVELSAPGGLVVIDGLGGDGRGVAPVPSCRVETAGAGDQRPPAAWMVRIEGLSSEAEARRLADSLVEVTSHAQLANVPGVGPAVLVEGGATPGQCYAILKLIGSRLPDGTAAMVVQSGAGPPGGSLVISRGGEPETVAGPVLVRGVDDAPVEVRATGPGTAVAVDGRFRGTVRIEPSERGGSLELVNLVALEDYLLGVVGCEMPADAPPEAIKAQAVASRSYLLSRLDGHAGARYDVHRDTTSQVYAGVSRERPAIEQAVLATRGVVLTVGGHPAPCYFHSTCGGATETDQHAFGGEGHGLVGVRDAEGATAVDRSSESAARQFILDAATSYCSTSPLFRWRHRLSSEDLQKALVPWVRRSKAVDLGSLRDLRVVSRSPSGRVVGLEAVGSRSVVRIAHEDVRLCLGHGWPGGGAVPSTLFAIEKRTRPDGAVDVYEFIGAGLGHGVGLCQYGAMGLARDGARFDAILGFYYPSFELLRVEGARWSRGSSP